MRAVHIYRIVVRPDSKATVNLNQSPASGKMETIGKGSNNPAADFHGALQQPLAMKYFLKIVILSPAHAYNAFSHFPVRYFC